MEIYNEYAYDLLDSKHLESPLENWNKVKFFHYVQKSNLRFNYLKMRMGILIYEIYLLDHVIMNKKESIY